MIKQTITIIIVTALVFFGLGFVFADYYKSDSNNGTFQDGWNAAKQRLIDSGLAPMMEEDIEITLVDGKVKQINGDKIILSIHPLGPLTDPELDERIVQIDNNTKFYQLKEKDEAQYQEEMEEFDNRIEEQEEQIDNLEIDIKPIFPPEMFIREEVSFSNIKIDQELAVIAQEDIKDTKEFKAVEIVVQSIN